MNTLLTIFTPTYNRGYCLERLYNSLLKQSNHDFLWFVVDDGSTDNTRVLINKLKNENKIKIEYHYQENEGKMAAHNWAVQKCHTELFMCLDSDDILTDNAVELILNKWGENIDKGICGILAPKFMTTDNNYLNITISKVKMTSPRNTLKGIYNDGYKGETALVFKTDIIKHFPFPIEQGEKFVPENLSYDYIDDNYQYLILEEPLMICAYQTDGYTRNIAKVYVANPKGSIKAFLHEFNRSKSFIRRIKLRMYMIAYGIIVKNKINDVLNITNEPLIMFCLFPLGIWYRCKLLKSLD